ncbi:MAG: AtpZ/AtpI family protein [Myxococcota bacterium]
MSARPRIPGSPTTPIGRGLEAGLEFGIGIVLGVAAGSYLDRKLGTDPLLLFLCTALGFAAGLNQLLRALRRGARKDPRPPPGDPRDPPA